MEPSRYLGKHHVLMVIFTSHGYRSAGQCLRGDAEDASKDLPSIVDITVRTRYKTDFVATMIRIKIKFYYLPTDQHLQALFDFGASELTFHRKRAVKLKCDGHSTPKKYL